MRFLSIFLLLKKVDSFFPSVLSVTKRSVVDGVESIDPPHPFLGWLDETGFFLEYSRIDFTNFFFFRENYIFALDFF